MDDKDLRSVPGDEEVAPLWLDIECAVPPEEMEDADLKSFHTKMEEVLGRFRKAARDRGLLGPGGVQTWEHVGTGAVRANPEKKHIELVIPNPDRLPEVCFALGPKDIRWLIEAFHREVKKM